MKELDIDNKSFYDIPTIGKTGSQRYPEGPVSGIPGREHKTSASIIAGNVPSMPKVKDAPDNDPTSWNSGGNGSWWSPISDTSPPKGDTEGVV